MEQPNSARLRVGEWCVNPAAGEISRNEETTRVEERTMRLLLCLAARAGEVVSVQDLLTQVWPDVAVTPDSVYQAVTSLRRLLGDDAKRPTYITTVPRQGYRLIAPVSVWEDMPAIHPPLVASDRAATRSRLAVGLVLGLLVGVLIAVGVFFSHRPVVDANSRTSPVTQSIAVLPFLDLTEGMQEEPFADGMTEELIDKLSKTPGLRVPAPTAVFYYKNKQVPIADMAKSLGVVYLLDGSVRKSGPRVRIAARLVRADNGYVLWTETYDRLFVDRIKVQDDIAGEVTKALKSSIVVNPRGSS